MTRPALVVLGAGLAQEGLIRRAQARGLTTCVVDGRADRPGLALADVPIHQDFTDAVVTLQRIREAGIEPLGVCSIASDVAVVPIAQLTSVLGLPGLPVHVAETATDKVAQRLLYAERSIPSAGFRAVSTTAEAEAAYRELGPAVIIKPRDGAAQRGVSEVHSPAAVVAAVEHAQRNARSGTILVEELLAGDEYTVNGFVLNGVFHLITVTERRLAPAPAVGVCVAHRFPCGRSAEETRLLASTVEAAALAIGIDNAPVYAQLRIGTTGPRMIECSARIGGGQDHVLARLVTGIDLVEISLDCALGLPVTSERLAPEPGLEPCGQVRFVIPDRPGRVARAAAGTAASLPGVHAVGFYHPVGGIVPPLRSASGRLGYVVVTGADEAELDRRTAAAEAALEITIDAMDDAAATSALADQISTARSAQAH